MKNKLNIDTILTYRKGLRVERLHTVMHINAYNNGFHSANAALIAIDLCVLNNIDFTNVVHYMLLHDIAEGYTGDIPNNVKMQHTELLSVLKRIEKDWEKTHLQNMPELNMQEKDICKVADLAELGMFCIEEINLGNKNVTAVLIDVIDYMRSLTHVKGCNELVTYLILRG